MGCQTQHPENPCSESLPEWEQTSAKIWELLRRNEVFRETVARLSQLDGRVKAETMRLKALMDQGVEQGQTTPEARELEAECRRRGDTKLLVERMLQNVGKTHPFAAAALQWLVPEPWFEVRHEIIAPGVDLTQTRFPPIRVVRLESGSTPDPSDKPNWSEFVSHGEFDAESARSIAGCAPMVRGPRFSFTVVEDARLQGSRINPIKEWKDYQTSHGPFSLSDSWHWSPIGFKRMFCWLWRLRDSREKNPLTRCRTDAPQEHETDFFLDWRLLQSLSRSAKTGQLKTEDFVRSLRLDDLADNYRIFAFPKSIRSRMEARRVAEWLFGNLCRLPDGSELPPREREILGTPLQWDIFLTVEKELVGGAPYTEAIMASFDLLHLKGQLSDDGQPNQSKLWGQRGASWENDYRTIHSPTSGNGLIQRIFPRLDPTFAPIS